MSSRGVSRYGKDAAGVWQRDAEGLPVYEWDSRRLIGGTLPWPHVLGTGRIQLSADQFGVLRLIAGPCTQREEVTAPGPGRISALRVEMQTADRILRLLPLAAPGAWLPQVRYGCGRVAYAVAIRDGSLPMRLDVSIDVLACPGRPYVLADITLSPGEGGAETLPCRLSVAADVSASLPSRSAVSPLYARDGVAMLGLGEGRDDAFLAGSSGWESHARTGRLELHRPLTLRPGEAVSMRVLLGYSASCSRQWLQQQFDGLTADAARAQIRASLQHPPIAAPELWIREELLWCRSALMAYQAQDPLTGRTILHPTTGTAAARTAHLLALCPFLQHAFPDLVRDTLIAVASRQGADGQLPESLASALPGARPDPSHDRSDTEVAFLWACARWLAEPGGAALLEQRFPEGALHAPSFSERLLRTVGRVRDGIGAGPHGLVRLLAGDWNGALDRAGGSGAGESVLTSAQFAAALRSLAESFRQAGQRGAADRLDLWQSEAAHAVGDAFRNGAFLRGYTDAGEAFGDPVSGPVYPEAQAWAVLARCGTVSQRREALERVLNAVGEGPLTTLTSAYPSTWPSPLCHAPIPPGEGANAGIGLLEAAWFLQALALEGRSADALARFQTLTLRRRAAADQRPPFPAICRAARVNGPAAQVWAWWPETAPGIDEIPPAAALAWEEEALRAILTPSPGT